MPAIGHGGGPRPRTGLYAPQLQQVPVPQNYGPATLGLVLAAVAVSWVLGAVALSPAVSGLTATPVAPSWVVGAASLAPATPGSVWAAVVPSWAAGPVVLQTAAPNLTLVAVTPSLSIPVSYAPGSPGLTLAAVTPSWTPSGAVTLSPATSTLALAIVVVTWGYTVIHGLRVLIGVYGTYAAATDAANTWANGNRGFRATVLSPVGVPVYICFVRPEPPSDIHFQGTP